GCPVGELRRQATLEGTLRLDDVVVDGDEGEGPVRLLRLGQESHLSLDVLGEVGVVDQFVEIGHLAHSSIVGGRRIRLRYSRNRKCLGYRRCQLRTSRSARTSLRTAPAQ